MDFYLKKIQDQGKLDVQIDASGIEKDIMAIGPMLDNLDKVVPALGIKRFEFRDIQDTNKGGNAQRCAVLRLWRRTNGGRATYRALLKILADINEGDAAEALVNCLDTGATSKVGGITRTEDTCVPDQVGKGTQYLGKTKPTSYELQMVKAETGETFRLTAMIAGKYKKIAATLGIDESEVTTIENSADYESRIDRVFGIWLQNASGLPRAKYYPLSWDGLKEILVDSELSAVATEFFSFLKKC